MNISARGNFANDIVKIKSADHKQIMVEIALALSLDGSPTYKTFEEEGLTVIGYAYDEGKHGGDW